MKWWCRRSDEDFSQEIQAAIALETDRLIATGLSRDEARQAALRAFGNVTRAQERYYRSRRVMWLDDLWRDVTYAFRTLFRNPGFTASIVFTLALGIGATTAIYSVVDTILLKPLPYPKSDRLVRIAENIAGGLTGPVFQRGPTYQQFGEWRTRASTVADATAVMDLGQQIVRTADGAVGLWHAGVATNAFSLFPAIPLYGRTFVPGDEAAPNVIVLSFETWQRHFRSDPSMVGTSVEFTTAQGPRLMTVVGILPRDFQLPTGRLDFYVPIGINPATASRRVTMLAQLKDGMSIEAAREEANAIGAAILPPRPANAPTLPGRRIEVEPIKDRIVREWRPALRVLLAAVIVVLLIVCANIANLLLARGTTRRREIVIRQAIGGTRGRIVRLVLAECAVLAVAGGVIGAIVSAASIAAIRDLAAIDAPGIFRLTFGTTVLPRGHEIVVNWRVLATALMLSVVACGMFGLVPALMLSRTDHLHPVASRGISADVRTGRMRAALAIGQLMMATMLLVGAGLLSLSFVRLSTINKGYDPTNVLAFQPLFPNQYSLERKVQTIDALLTGLRATPGVEAAGFSRAGVLIGEEIAVGTLVPRGRTLEEVRNLPGRPRLRPVSAGFLTAMGIPLIAGREFQASDTATTPPVIVINRSLAREYFGAATPIAEPVDWYAGKGTATLSIVGIVEDLRNESLASEPYPEAFIEYRQLLRLLEQWGEREGARTETAIGRLSLAIRTVGDPAAAVPTVRHTVNAVDPNVGIDAIVPIERLVAGSLARQRLYAVIVGVFASVAGLLALIGVYGVLAYAVVQRTQEIGIRMALGARVEQVLSLVLRRGLLMIATGIALGLGGAIATTRFLQAMLFGVTPLDRWTFVGVAVIFAAVSTFACYLPARRATKVDPLVAVRCE
jgi:putative ABC transport system permease protein